MKKPQRRKSESAGGKPNVTTPEFQALVADIVGLIDAARSKAEAAGQLAEFDRVVGATGGGPMNRQPRNVVNLARKTKRKKGRRK